MNKNHLLENFVLISLPSLIGLVIWCDVNLELTFGQPYDILSSYLTCQIIIANHSFESTRDDRENQCESHMGNQRCHQSLILIQFKRTAIK